ncbi:MarR family winged helix-turn-helix transcriptional regulator [Pseudooceanicola sp.]|uniref:MarR family winged helix-turn-helix transcriptional regulator n=1 Tax=Pseudooceanicola sp. TaxID=1914328 RepID=UPI00262553E5|nr:MarR family winged helix-turn-helix transcriptional regulator [Pseudooceanicola sp.]MDF1856235.1 MarR family winged helix-turn-helix transcriptional regulator [Pseudooceanicola sp.]
MYIGGAVDSGRRRTYANQEGRIIGSRDDITKRYLARAGIPPEVSDRALKLDAIVQNWRRRVQKREIGRMALRELDLPLDLPKLDVLIAIWAPSNEFGRNDAETMVSTIATRLGIDPSRASRLVSDLIGQGFVKRCVSQEDARRTVVDLTDQGLAIVDAVRTIKFLMLGDYLKSWPIEEIDAFVPQMERFFHWSDQAETMNSGRLKPEIEKLANKLKQSLD